MTGKRLFDIIAAGTGLLLAFPIMLIAAVGVVLTSRGPIFFAQRRAGRDGRTFRSIKFRTMRADHVHDLTEIIPLTHPAITVWGRFLRRTKIDELPQLWNVLIGDMSIVGPRPALPEQAAQYDAFARQRLEVRPGVTGLAQVNSSAAMPWPERHKYDVYYVHHRGAWLDLKILTKTIAVIALGESRFARLFERSPYHTEA